MSERIDFLKRCDLFARLTADELSGLEGRSLLRKFARHSPIYVPGDPAEGVVLLTQGRVRICDFTSDGKQVILAFIEPGELFGELALVDASPREERAEAVVASTVMLLPVEALQELLDAVPELSLGITRLIGLRRRRIERRLKTLLFRSNRERLVNLLLDLAEQYGRPGPAGVALDIRLSHQDLASIIGSTREAVTIVLGELRDEGKLTMTRQSIVLTCPGRLAEQVDRDEPGAPDRATPDNPSAAESTPPNLGACCHG
jgi:CRP-like cAMP-binding protein